MSAQSLSISWYRDPVAESEDVPGISHSFVASLATALEARGARIDPVWLMGVSGFAFRIWASHGLCPSAMSVFSWERILPEAVEQVGYHCTYVDRMWDEDRLRDERRRQAHEAIVAAIERGVPAVVWDVADCEWGLVTGYDTGSKQYDIFNHQGQASHLAFDRLGDREIKILSVAIPGEPNGRSREEAIRRSLEAAVAHADEQEWLERPDYQDGLAAYNRWAQVIEQWAGVLDAGKETKIGVDVQGFADYYARNHYSARRYASLYLKDLADGDRALAEAAVHYAAVARHLRDVWGTFAPREAQSPDTLRAMAKRIREAQAEERAGVDCIRACLGAATVCSPGS